MNDTLIIYNSDHSELLGKNEMIGHNSPVCPEISFVPTIMIYPNLPDSCIISSIMNHVDLFPTMLDILDVDHDPDFDGQSMINEPPNESRYTTYKSKFLDDKIPLINIRLQFNRTWD